MIQHYASTAPAPEKYTDMKIPRRLTFEETRGMTNIFIAGHGSLLQKNDCHTRGYSAGRRPGIFVLVELVPSFESLRSNTQDDGHWRKPVTSGDLTRIFLSRGMARSYKKMIVIPGDTSKGCDGKMH